MEERSDHAFVGLKKIRACKQYSRLSVMTDYQFVISEADFPDDDRFVTTLSGWRVFVIRLDGEFFAINDRCPHAASILSTGRVRRGHVMCPLHGARFDMKSGKCAGGAYPDVRTFPIRVENGDIEVAVPADPPAANEVPVHFE